MLVQKCFLLRICIVIWNKNLVLISIPGRFMSMWVINEFSILKYKMKWVSKVVLDHWTASSLFLYKILLNSQFEYWYIYDRCIGWSDCCQRSEISLSEWDWMFRMMDESDHLDMDYVFYLSVNPSTKAFPKRSSGFCAQ